ncbi:MAG: S1 RNA-binding domain-containing protein [Anaerolineae bacterium]|nr:S1 RNA-binding domain-containing protein [Anaerolineae bacterium]
MSTNVQRHDLTPPPLEEGYWDALLKEGEYAEPVRFIHEIDHHTEIETDSHALYDNGDNSTGSQNDWAAMQHIMDQDQVVILSVVGYNRGGLLVEWQSLRGFVPASQLMNFPATAPLNVRRNALADRIGQTLNLRVIELNPDQNRLILSERAARVEAGERAQILTRLGPGDHVRGSITNLCDFGAFVDLGGLEGLIHISELSWGRVGHPADMLRRGQEIEVYVLSVDRENARIALSLKRLFPDPWKTVNDRYTIGQTVVGTITNVVDFGAFACIEEGLEGLIHVSELAEGHFLHPRNVVSEGQEIEARILSIDSEARRLGLSLRTKP